MFHRISYKIPVLIAVAALGMSILSAAADATTSGSVEVNPRLVRLGVPFSVTVKITADENIRNPRVEFPEPE